VALRSHGGRCEIHEGRYVEWSAASMNVLPRDQRRSHILVPSMKLREGRV
jgi:hypothetical protein